MAFRTEKKLKMLCDEFDYEPHYKSVYAEALRAEEGSFITWNQSEAGTERYEPLVRNGAIIIDNMSASAGEAPVMFVRRHNGCRAKVYGRERTDGCALSHNCNFIRLPHSNITLSYPIGIFDTYEQVCKERKPGYNPDVIIPLPYPEQLTDNIDSWVKWVAKKMR